MMWKPSVKVICSLAGSDWAGSLARTARAPTQDARLAKLMGPGLLGDRAAKQAGLIS
jgi:hypothetical protein